MSSNSKQLEQTVQKCSITPNTSKLLQVVVPALGHNMTSAFLDLLDNCYDAGASSIKICINDAPKEAIKSYYIIDNGCGMDKETLIESYRFATETAHSEGDLGKFGIGGTVSIYTLGEKCIKLSKTVDGPLLAAELDISDSNPSLKYDDPLMLRSPTQHEIDLFTEHCGDKGTMIIIDKLRKKEYTNSRHLSNRLVKELGESFYQRINSKSSLSIDIPEHSNPDLRSRKVATKDPLLGESSNSHKVKSSYVENIEYGDHLIRIRFTELDRSTTAPEERRMQDQGIYWNRNNRLISSGCSHKVLWSKHNSLNCGRVEISFSEALDAEFGVGALKNNINPSQSIISVIKPSITKFLSQVKKTDKNAPLDEDISSLEKEDQNFTNQLKMSAASIELPKSSPTETSDPKIIDLEEVRDANKNGRGPDKKPRVPRLLLTPKFVYVNEPRTPAPWWHDFDEGLMVITINKSHKFIKENFISDEARLLIRKIVAAESLAAYDLSIYDENANGDLGDNITLFLEKMAEKLNAIDKNVK